MTEPKKDELLRAPEVADLDPYNTRGKPKHDAARELIGDEPEVQEDENFDGPKFNLEQVGLLTSMGWEIHHIKRESLKTLGEKFSEKGLELILGSDFAGDSVIEIENVFSKPTEVAVRKEEPYFTSSFMQTFKEQMDHVIGLDNYMRDRIQGVRIRVGTASDYASIYLQFDSLFDRNLTRTVSEVSSTYAAIGEVTKGKVVVRNDIDHNFKDAKVGVIPLIFPIPDNDRT